MSSAAFIKALSKRLYPILRAEGFKGSGNTLRRINDPVVRVFNVQDASSGQECYLNLGAHLMFLSPEWCTTEASELKEYECAFRDRFDPPAGPGFGWATSLTQEDLEESISFICDHWKIYGHEFFNQYTAYPADFEKLVANVDMAATHPIDLLLNARIAIELGIAHRAQAFLGEAMKRCPKQATALQSDLEMLLASVKNT